MTKKTKTGTVKTAFGKRIKPALNYSYSWDEYDTYAEVVSNNNLFTNEEVVKVRNEQRKIAAAAKAKSDTLKAAGIVPDTAENNPQIRLRSMFDTLMTATNDDGSKLYTEEQARALASQMVRVEWQDDEDED